MTHEFLIVRDWDGTPITEIHGGDGKYITDNTGNLVWNEGEGWEHYKNCTGCSAILPASDPDVCELCDLHGDEPDLDVAIFFAERYGNPIPGAIV